MFIFLKPKYKRFYEIYDHQLLKTRVLKKENPKMVLTKPKAIQNPGLDLTFTWV